MTGSRGLAWLRWVATFELLSLLVLLTNLATANDHTIAAAVGPLHGAAYLTVIVALLARDGTATRARLLAFVPGVGAFLALRELQSRRSPGVRP